MLSAGRSPRRSLPLHAVQPRRARAPHRYSSSRPRRAPVRARTSPLRRVLRPSAASLFPRALLHVVPPALRVQPTPHIQQLLSRHTRALLRCTAAHAVRRGQHAAAMPTPPPAAHHPRTCEPASLRHLSTVPALGPHDSHELLPSVDVDHADHPAPPSCMGPLCQSIASRRFSSTVAPIATLSSSQAASHRSVGCITAPGYVKSCP